MPSPKEKPVRHISAGDVYREYNRLLRGFRWPFVLSATAVIVASMIGLATPWIFRGLFDVISTATPSTATAGKALYFFCWFAATEFAGFVVWRISGFLTAWAVPEAIRRLHMQTYAYLIRHSYRFFSDRFAGSVVRQFNRFMDAFDQMHDIIHWEFIPMSVTIVGTIISLASRSVWLGLFMAGWLVIYYATNYWLALWKLRYDNQRSDADSRMVGELSDSLSNSLNMKMFAAYGIEEKRYGNAVGVYIRLWWFTWNLSEIIMAVQVFLFIILEVGIIYLVIHFWVSGALAVGDFALVQLFVLQVFNRVWNLSRHIRRMFEATATATEMVEALETPHEVADKEGAVTLAVTRGKIEFRNVSFGYHDSRDILRSFDLTIQPGEKVALVGASGAGKSTVTKLLLRFFDVADGSILIDGQDIAGVELEGLWRAIGYVPQEPVLFHRSLKENIRYGKPGAPEDGVAEAARKARCHDFISSLPGGYDTFVGERGVKLSGGERQRVAIARTILKNAPILVLDEATSSLDSESEQLIQEALGDLMQGKTVVVIAHRLSTIMKMDRIIVIDQGRIVEQGTHQELLKKVGTYQRLWHIQAGGFQADR